ncbi:MAG: TolC family protein [Bacteroidales bacterium]|nr:TolC family protein [Bacteroidales bacterium]
MKHIIVSLMMLACMLGSLPLYAQKTWTLQECIDYAIEHNIDLQKQAELVNQQKIQLNSANNARLPQLSAEVDDDFVFHQNLSNGLLPSTDGSASYSNLTGLSGSLNASLPIYDGRLDGRRKVAQFNLESVLARQDQARKDIGIHIAVQYLNILYHQGLAKVCRQQVELSGDFVSKAEKQFEQGAKPESELVQARSQLAEDEYQLAVAEGDEQLSTIQLAQLLMLEDVSDFRIYDPSLETDILLPRMLPPADSLFSMAENSYPDILAAQADIRAAEAGVKLERSQLFPTLDLIGSIGTQGYRVSNDKYYSLMPDFSRQLEKNHLEIIGLRLKFPIFSALQTRNAINLAQSQVTMQKLNLADRRLLLRTEIEQAYYNANIAFSRHEAAKKAEISAHTNYDYQLKSYEAGRTTIFDLNLVNQQWLRTLQDVLQSKYDYLIRLKILDFYISNEFTD